MLKKVLLKKEYVSGIHFDLIITHLEHDSADFLEVHLLIFIVVRCGILSFFVPPEKVATAKESGPFQLRGDQPGQLQRVNLQASPPAHLPGRL